MVLAPAWYVAFTGLLTLGNPNARDGHDWDEFDSVTEKSTSQLLGGAAVSRVGEMISTSRTCAATAAARRKNILKRIRPLR